MKRKLLFVFFISLAQTMFAQDYENQMLAGIDVGGKAAKLTIVHQKKGKFSVLLDSNLVTNITDFTPEIVSKTSEIILRLFNIAALDYNIQRSNIYVVLSSGLVNAANASKNSKALEYVKNKLQEDVSDLVNKVQAITGPQESMFTFLGQIPKEQQKDACSLNIGSSNTMFGNLAPNDELLYNSFFYSLGTKSLTNLIGSSYDSLSTLSSYVATMQQIAPEKINPFYTKDQFKNTGFTSKSRVILNGGICWALANFVYPNNFEDAEVIVKAKDIANFIAAVKKNTKLKKGELKADINSAKLSPTKVSMVNNVLGEINKVYTEKSILAGALYLEKLLNEMHDVNPKADFVFVRDSNNAWIKGFLMYGSKGKANSIKLAN